MVVITWWWLILQSNNGECEAGTYGEIRGPGNLIACRSGMHFFFSAHPSVRREGSLQNPSNELRFL